MYRRTFWSDLDKEKEIRQKYLQISEEVSVKLPLKKGQYNYRKVAKTTHIGTLGMIYNFIVPYIEEENLEIIGPQLFQVTPILIKWKRTFP